MLVVSPVYNLHEIIFSAAVHIHMKFLCPDISFIVCNKETDKTYLLRRYTTVNIVLKN